MALEDHLRLALLVDGRFQVKVTAISINGDSGAQRVDTLEGLAGKTNGSGSCNISGTWAVAQEGPEFDLLTAVALGTYHELQIPVGTKTIVTRGWFQDNSLSQSVNASTEISANFIGELKPPV